MRRRCSGRRIIKLKANFIDTDQRAIRQIPLARGEES
jgi:hypothetical protein